MVRIISGECKGRILKTVRGRSVRPTSDRAKETLFDILSDRIHGCRFLDLYSGTGSVGLEAVSRGAINVVMVESDFNAFKRLNENTKNCEFEERVTMINSDSKSTLSRLASEQHCFDLIFMDPPYKNLGAYGMVEMIGNTGLLENGGLVIAEHDRHHELPGNYGELMRVRIKRIGDTMFSFYGGEGEG